MGVAHIITGAINGIDAVNSPSYNVCDTTPGVPVLNIVGLPDATVNEAKERLKSAIKNAGFQFPLKKVIINLAPADVRKTGASFDLPMAVGILDNTEYFPQSTFLQHTCFAGELSLDGSIRPIKGTLAIALMAKYQGIDNMVVPKANMAEASLIEGLTIYGIEHLGELPQLLDNPALFQSQLTQTSLLAAVKPKNPTHLVDFKDIKGQVQAKRALEIAAAGGHNIALFGPPGSGKSMLAKAFQGILPPMTVDEMLEVSRIYSVSGMLDADTYLVSTRPFRAPHHSASTAGIIGGGSHPKPGEITLSHRGVLFLDEFTEFPRAVLEVLRQPLEDGVVTVSRAQQTQTFPAEFILLAAMNPCPCGYKGDTEKPCVCTHTQVTRYLGKLSGPLMDRIDLQLEVPRLSDTELLNHTPDSQPAESSQTIQERVSQARALQQQRFANTPHMLNATMAPADLKRHCALTPAGETLMQEAAKRFHLSGRSFDRLLKLARTIADLDTTEAIAPQHLSEALQYRSFEKLTQGHLPSLSNV